MFDILYNTKQLKFYKEDYFRVDLNRVSEIEELITEWYELSMTDSNDREETLKSYGFLDLCGHKDDFETIVD